MLPEDLAGIAENYNVRKLETERVAGAECQSVALEPKDNLRYGHRFCAEVNTGLLLRARTYNDMNEMIESFAFTQLLLGTNVTRDMLKSRYASQSKDWRTDRSALDRGDAVGVAGGGVLRFVHPTRVMMSPASRTRRFICSSFRDMTFNSPSALERQGNPRSNCHYIHFTVTKKIEICCAPFPKLVPRAM